MFCILQFTNFRRLILNMGTYLGLILVVLGFVLIRKIWKVFSIVVWRPYILTKSFEKQGIRGPPYKLFYGSLPEMKKLKREASQIVFDVNSNDFLQKILPHYSKWSQEYGETVLYWYGTQPRITISDPELAKQVLSNKFGFYSKPQSRPSVLKLTGNGLAIINGSEWARHRRILNPAFSMDKLKVMVKRMAKCTIDMLVEWQNQVNAAENKSVKILMNQEFQKLTADIIAHTAFGSSYIRGKEAFTAQKELQKCCAASMTDMFIPGSQYFPTPSNRQIWKLDKKIRNSLGQVIEKRLNYSGSSLGDYGDDLLGLMIRALKAPESQNNPKLNMDEIMEECKMFFFAGHETTSNLLTWSMFLLSLHQEWQEKVRQEVLTECGMRIPDGDMLAKLKLVNMVLLESLRLYGPVIQMARETSEDMKLGNLMIPKNTCVMILTAKIHRSKEYWGEDANEFNPLRFMNGTSKAAKHPNALIAFSVGPRACIGQNFAMLEAKTVLALILQRFSFLLAPEYKHAPSEYLTLQPQYGLPIILRPFDN